MVPVARRNLMAEKTSFLVAVGGVAFAVFLIIIILGIYLEFRRTFTVLIDDVPAQVWVVQDGAFDMFHSDSTLPEGLAEPVAQIPGVRSVQKLVGGQTSFRTEDGDRSRECLPGEDVVVDDEPLAKCSEAPRMARP
jgi:putative ABC transport system permease protein